MQSTILNGKFYKPLFFQMATAAKQTLNAFSPPCTFSLFPWEDSLDDPKADAALPVWPFRMEKDTFSHYVFRPTFALFTGHYNTQSLGYSKSFLRVLAEMKNRIVD